MPFLTVLCVSAVCTFLFEEHFNQWILIAAFNALGGSRLQELREASWNFCGPVLLLKTVNVQMSDAS